MKQVIASLLIASSVLSCAAWQKDAPLVSQDVADLVKCVVANDKGADLAVAVVDVTLVCGAKLPSDVEKIIVASRAAKAVPAASGSAVAPSPPAQ
jgi:hypothetical protein